jgi:uncharacterized phiE125 gp8 family phage protein
MTATLTTPPAIEPVSLAEAKTHLRVDGDDDDSLIAATITAARLFVEQATRRALLAQGWRVLMDAWPASRTIEMPIAPLIEVNAVSVIDDGSDEIEVDQAAYEIDVFSTPPRLLLVGSLPSPGRGLNGIAIDVTAGYGEAADAVPAPLLQAILQLVAHWYENRSAVSYDRSQGVAPLGVDALIAPYRVLAL